MTRRLLEELLATEGVVEEVGLGSRVGVMAFHGGNLEAGTDQIALEVAGRTGASLYVVRQPEGLRWHIPSIRFERDQSAGLDAFLGHVDSVVTIHGYGRRSMFRTVLLGGGNRRLAGLLGRHLRRELPHYEVIDELDDIPVELRGLHPRNPVNVPAERGVQVELPPRIRGEGPFWSSWSEGPTPHTESLVAALSAGVEEWTRMLPGQGASRSTTQPDPSGVSRR